MCLSVFSSDRFLIFVYLYFCIFVYLFVCVSAKRFSNRGGMYKGGKGPGAERTEQEGQKLVSRDELSSLSCSGHLD